MNLYHLNQHIDDVDDYRNQIETLLIKTQNCQDLLFETRGYRPELAWYKMKPKGSNKYYIETMYSGYYRWRTIGRVYYPKILDKLINVDTIPGWKNESTQTSIN